MLSPHISTLYTNLLNLCNKSDAFYFIDHNKDEITYRVFSYRIASYTDFLLPDACECRGIMFELDTNQHPVRLVCRPPHKFFNLNENPLTTNLDLSLLNIHFIMDKIDGSLISTYLHNNSLCVKSKTSLSSEQVTMAMNFLNKKENSLLKETLYTLTASGFTVNLEYVGPDNRIVIGYTDRSLKILNIRNNETGEYLTSIYNKNSELNKFVVNTLPLEFDLETLKAAEGIEGVVVVLKSGHWFKVKTSWYLTLHHTKDSINSKRRLFECIIQETVDDLKSMFYADDLAIKTINEMEQLVVPKYDHLIKTIEEFYEMNKSLDRKSYAIKGQTDLPERVFGLAMNKYTGKLIDYKTWAIKNYDWFNIKDEVVTQE